MLMDMAKVRNKMKDEGNLIYFGNLSLFFSYSNHFRGYFLNLFSVVEFLRRFPWIQHFITLRYFKLLHVYLILNLIAKHIKNTFLLECNLLCKYLFFLSCSLSLLFLLLLSNFVTLKKWATNRSKKSQSVASK